MSNYFLINPKEERLNQQAIKDYKRGGSATRSEISMFLNSKNIRRGRPTFPLFCEILGVEPEILSQRLKEEMRQSCDLHR
jgi:hypothetical protein